MLLLNFNTLLFLRQSETPPWCSYFWSDISLWFIRAAVDNGFTLAAMTNITVITHLQSSTDSTSAPFPCLDFICTQNRKFYKFNYNTKKNLNTNNSERTASWVFISSFLLCCDSSMQSFVTTIAVNISYWQPNVSLRTMLAMVLLWIMIICLFVIQHIWNQCRTCSITSYMLVLSTLFQHLLSWCCFHGFSFRHIFKKRPREKVSITSLTKLFTYNFLELGGGGIWACLNFCHHL